jgi:hypothetical protein
VTFVMTRRIEEILGRHGPMRCQDLRRRVGRRARGPHTMVVLALVRWRGLSQEFGDAVEHLILSGAVRVANTGKQAVLVRCRNQRQVTT